MLSSVDYLLFYMKILVLSRLRISFDHYIVLRHALLQTISKLVTLMQTEFDKYSSIVNKLQVTMVNKL